jgi:hypothetical protein
VVVNNHLPEDSALFQNVVTHQNLQVATANLQCSLATAGTQVELKDTTGQPLPNGAPILGSSAQPLPFDAVTQSALDCGTSKFPDAIPYVVLLLLMLASAVYQQRQMQKANPPAANAGPQQAIMKYMPLIYVVWGWQFPAGLVLYWTTANAIQITQQTVMLRAGHIGPDALERRMAEQRERIAKGGPQKKGIMGWMNEKAEAAQGQQKQARPTRGDQDGAKSDGSKADGSRGGRPKPKAGGTPPQKNPAKPVKGAKPGNQLKPKNKRKS